MNNLEIFVLIAVIILVVFIVLPALTRVDRSYHDETFSAIQDISTPFSTVDPMLNENSLVRPMPDKKNFESLIYDSITGTVMTGSDFMANSGLITPPFVLPAWSDGTQLGPSSKSELDPADYENDPRLLYNKCSLACCSPQYPLPFALSPDPFVCDEEGNNKYYPSNYTCTNNISGSGCLCISEAQMNGFENGFVDYYVDKKNLGY